MLKSRKHPTEKYYAEIWYADTVHVIVLATLIHELPELPSNDERCPDNPVRLLDVAREGSGEKLRGD